MSRRFLCNITYIQAGIFKCRRLLRICFGMLLWGVLSSFVVIARSIATW